MGGNLEDTLPRSLFGSVDHFFHLAKKLPAAEQEILAEALFSAAEWHGDQRRKSGPLYLIHPVQVACILMHFQADFEVIVAALLHDTLEDTDATSDEIEKRFGADVARLVEALTKLKIFSTRENYEKLYARSRQDPRVAWIKIADACANLMHGSQLVFTREKHLEHLEETEHFHYELLTPLPSIPKLLTSMLRRAIDQSRKEYEKR